MDHWNNRSLVRAMAIESFKMFKPSAYNLIKSDYGDYSGDFDDVFLLSSDWCPNHLTKTDKHKMIKTIIRKLDLPSLNCVL